MNRVACGMLQDAAGRILSSGHEIGISDLVSLLIIRYFLAR